MSLVYRNISSKIQILNLISGKTLHADPLVDYEIEPSDVESYDVQLRLGTSPVQARVFRPVVIVAPSTTMLPPAAEVPVVEEPVRAGLTFLTDRPTFALHEDGDDHEDSHG